MDAKQQNRELTMEACLLVHVLIISAITFIPGTECTKFIVQNNCPYTIWPAISLDNNSHDPVGTSGFALPQGLSYTIDAPSDLDWKGRLWARTFCRTNSSGVGVDFICSTGDCGSGQVYCNGSSGDQPVTLIEFNLNVFVVNIGGILPRQDFYDVSLVHGFNLPVTITPRSSGCESVSCPKDLNSVCPSQMTIKDAAGTGVVACKSACSVFNTDANCCTGNFSTAETCTSHFARVFTSHCPEAHSYDYDEYSISCPTGGDYFITFCPISSPQPKYLGMLCY